MNRTPEVIFEDDDLAVVNKPAGLLTLPDRHNDSLPSLSAILKKKYGQIFVVHRLDRDTSGIIVFAKNAPAHQSLSRQFESRETRKFYLALVNGRMPLPSGTIDQPLMEHPSQRGKMIISKKGKTAVTDFEVVEDFRLYTLVRLTLHTGRTHQIRVHMQSAGHPVAVDELYGDGKPVYLSAIKRHYRISRNEETERPLMHRLALHAHRLIFRSLKGDKHDFTAPLPKDFQAVLNQLRKNSQE